MNDRGSILPLVIGFAFVGLLMSAVAVAAGDAFVQQRDLQALCDGAAVAAAADAVALDRSAAVGAGDDVAFAAVDDAVRRYLDRDPGRAGVQVAARLSADRRTIALTCVRTERLTFGRLVGKPGGARHVAHASARAPTSAG